MVFIDKLPRRNGCQLACNEGESVFGKLMYWHSKILINYAKASVVSIIGLRMRMRRLFRVRMLGRVLTVLV